MSDAQKDQLAELLRKGKYTTEFWLMFAAQVVGGLLASGILTDQWGQIAGIAAMVLGAMGYTFNRSLLKGKAIDLIGAEAAAERAPVALEPSPDVKLMIEAFKERFPAPAEAPSSE